MVIGGGAGGCSTAANFVPKVGKGGVAVVEPRDKHAYQPLWTLVGGGQKNFEVHLYHPLFCRRLFLLNIV